MVSLLEEAVNTLCRIHKDLGQFTAELKDIKGAVLERAAKYLKDVVGISGFKANQSREYITTIRDCRNMVVHNGGELRMISSQNAINLILDIEKKTLSYTLNMLMW